MYISVSKAQVKLRMGREQTEQNGKKSFFLSNYSIMSVLFFFATHKYKAQLKILWCIFRVLH